MQLYGGSAKSGRNLVQIKCIDAPSEAPKDELGSL